MLFQAKQKKRGVSEMVGYILLITIGIAMSIIVFTWLKGYVPSGAIECSEGVSIFIKSSTCTGNTLEIELKNNGRFALRGFLIHATTTEEQELATQDLSTFYSGLKGNQEIIFGLDANKNGLDPNSEGLYSFDLSTLGKTIYFIEVIPTRYETVNGKNKVATCTKAKVKQDIVCPNINNLFGRD